MRSRVLSSLRLQADLVIVAAGFVYQIVGRLLTFHLGFDDVFLISSGISFSRGGGLGQMVVDSWDLTKVSYQLLNYWPPGYSVLIAGLFKLCHDPYITAVSAELLGLAALGGGIVFLLYRLRPSLSFGARLLIAAIAGWWGPPIMEYHTNVWSLALFVWGTNLLLPRDNGSEPFWLSASAGAALLALTIPFRYAYGAVAVAATATAVVCALASRQRWRSSLALVFGWALGLAPFVLWKVWYAGNPNIGRTHVGDHLYFSSLWKFHAFAADALFGSRLDRVLPDSCYKFRATVNLFRFRLRHLLSLAVLAAAALGARTVIRGQANEGPRVVVSRFFTIGLVVTIVNVLFLGWLSVLNAPEPSLANWVYVCEPRYFLPSQLFILFGVAVTAIHRSKRTLLTPLRDVMIALVSVSALSWFIGLPNTIGRLRNGTIGGPFDKYLMDGGSFLAALRPVAARGPTVFVEVGTPLGGLPHAEASIIDVPSSFVPSDGIFQTPQDRQILFMYGPGREQPKTDQVFNDLCRRYEGRPFESGEFHYCPAIVRAKIDSKPPAPPSPT